MKSFKLVFMAIALFAFSSSFTSCTKDLDVQLEGDETEVIETNEEEDANLDPEEDGTTTSRNKPI